MSATRRLTLEREREKRRRQNATVRSLWLGAHGAIPGHWLELVAELDAWLVRYSAAPGGDTTRILATSCPGAAKSTLARTFAAASIARGLSVIYLSYSAVLARNHSRFAQSIVLEQLGGKLDREVRGAGQWAIQGAPATMLASGLSGTASGFRGPVVIVDDYCPNIAEAWSVSHRERAISNVQSVARTRCEPGGLVLVASTLWHPKDAGAKCIEAGYRVHKVPSITPGGASFWPDRFSIAELRGIEEEIGDRDFAALYQCAPASSGAQLFGDVTLIHPRDLPTIVHKRGGLDCAYSARTTADASVGLVLAELADGRHCVVDVLREQLAFGDFTPRLRAFSEAHGHPAFRWRVGGQERALAETLRQQGVRVDDEPARTDKVTAAQPAASAWQRGKLCVLAGQPWTDRFVSEVTAFPSRRDDQVDALINAIGSTPLEHLPARKLTPEEEYDRWRRKLERESERRRLYGASADDAGKLI